MKKLLALSFVFLLHSKAADAQLSSVAQAIYDSCNVYNPLNVSYAINNGVQVISTPDSSSFYLQWFPPGAIPNSTPLIVTLHGSKGNAFNEFKSWHTSALSHNCGIIALQYNKYTNVFNYLIGYFHDDTIYNYLDAALMNIAYPSNKALLHGFSLGSARTYAVIYNDIQSGKNYFCTTISNAGKIDLTYPLYNSINGIQNVFIGKHWNLFCGPPEPPYTGGACDGLNFTQNWLISKGAIVDIYIQDSLLGHNGFQQTISEPYKDTMLNKYLECYNGSSSVNLNLTQAHKSIFYPNPFYKNTCFQTNYLLEAATLSIYNVFGQQVKQFQNINGTTFTFNRDNLPNGIYFIQLSQALKVIYTDKLILEGGQKE
ncbi:MAG: T9SS type A sorting domain-containing protein [Bacteroidetes bacterium]|nr:T9SS type A sorting domain-containing protein [Bacteroidota bacterium]